MQSRLFVCLLALLGLLIALSPTHLQAQVLAEGGELIVLTRADSATPSAEELVMSVQAGEGRALALLTVPAGSPITARYLLTERATDAMLDGLRADPDSPRAILERYLVVSYPAGVNLDKVREELLQRPEILFVGHDQIEQSITEKPTGTFSRPSANAALPNALTLPAPDWHIQRLNLPAAWNLQRGYAYITAMDSGLQPSHPALQTNWLASMSLDFTGAQLSTNVDELAPPVASFAGHGTHVAGLIAGTPNPTQGTSGSCRDCRLAMSKVAREGSLQVSAVANAIIFMSERAGPQVINLSLGSAYAGYNPNQGTTCPPGNWQPVCFALASAATRDVVVVAASGNARTAIQYPASDPRVIAVGGIDSSGGFWDEGCSEGGAQCGSNRGPQQAVVAPAKWVKSTVYQNQNHIPPTLYNDLFGRNYGDDGCGDHVPVGAPTTDGYGYCTGTSMSAPLVSGIVGLIRSTNPLLSAAAVRQILTSTSALPSFCAGGGCPPDQWGAGIPNAEAAVRATLGRSGGLPLVNRLTPLFGFYLYDTVWDDSPLTDYMHTVVPQMAASVLLDEGELSSLSVGTPVPGYSAFPGAPGRPPRAELHVFTTHVSPLPNMSLVPLRRSAYYAPGQPATMDHTYVTSPHETLSGYVFEGIEGYIYAPCTPESSCIPAGAVRVYRLYHPTLVDYAIVPEARLYSMQQQGYRFPRLLGYAYPNVDSDGDTLIDGFERLAGTNLSIRDTDGDGISDGQELLVYPYRDPRIRGN